VLAVALLLPLALLPTGVGGSVQALAHEAIAGGLAATVLAALLLSLTGVLATLALTLSRFHRSVAVEQGRSTAGPVGEMCSITRASRRAWARRSSCRPGQY